MSNVLLAWNNRADVATLSGGNWSATLPITNLQNRQVQKVARTAGVALSDTVITADFGTAQSINCIALVVHNLSESAKVRITAASNSGFTSPEYQSPWIEVWPAGLINAHLLEWEDDNFWLGTMSAEQRAGYNAPFLHVLPAPIYMRYWRIEIDDVGNPAGYVQVGRLFAAKSWQPQYNMAYGAALGFEDPSETVTSLGGAEYFDVRGRYRVHRFALEVLSKDERYTYIHELQRLVGTTGEVLVVPNPADPSTLIQRSFVGRLRKLDAPAQPHYRIFSANFEIKELL